MGFKLQRFLLDSFLSVEQLLRLATDVLLVDVSERVLPLDCLLDLVDVLDGSLYLVLGLGTEVFGLGDQAFFFGFLAAGGQDLLLVGPDPLVLLEGLEGVRLSV